MSDDVIPISQLQEGNQYVTVEQQAAKDAATENRFKNIETLIYAIVFLTIVTLVGIVVAVSAMIQDQMHFNHELYREGKHIRTETDASTEYVQPIIFPKVKESI